MTFTGNKNIFAIEWAIDSYHSPYYYGYFCFWINNRQVGNFDEISTLSIIASYLDDFLKKSGTRHYPGSHNMNKEALFHFLHEKFFDGSDKDSQTYLRMHEFSETFWLDEVGEYSFRDKISMIIIDESEDDRQRLIWKEFATDKLYESFIPGNYFDRIANQFLNDFKSATLNM